MPRSLRQFCAIWFLLIPFLAGPSCGGNKGIEAGNPSVAGQKLRVIPREGSEVYLVRFDSGSEATVTQIQVNILSLIKRAQARVSTVLDEVTVPYSVTDGLLRLDAAFSNGLQITIEAALDAEGTFTSVVLEVDGMTVVADFDQEMTLNGCDSGTQNPGMQLVEGYCSRLVECNANTTCTVCREGMLASADADQAGSFGADGLTLQEMVDAVESGTLVAEGSNLALCLSDMAALSCDELTTDYEEVEEAIPGEENDDEGCPAVF